MFPINMYPYTDFHELNQDWIISEIKRLAIEYAKLNKDFTDFEEYVKNYLANLDVEQYVIDYINYLWDSGQLDPIITAAINALTQRVDAIETEIKNGGIENYYYSYMKVGETTDAPIIVIDNPVRSAVSYFTKSDAYGNVIGGDLDTDMITPVNTVNITGLTHINDATYCNATNEILVADYIAGTPRLVRMQPASLQPIADVDLTAWQGTSIGEVSCDNTNNVIYIAGETADNNVIQFGIMDTDYNIVKQFSLNLGLENNEDSYPFSFTQCSDIVNGDFCMIKTMRNATPRQNGCIITSIDFINEKIKATKQINAGDEAESLMYYNGNIYLYGLTNASNANIYATCTVLSLSPINNLHRAIYVDESEALNGSGTNDMPYNNLSSAIYDLMNSGNKSVINLKSDISKELILPPDPGTNTAIRIVGNDHKISLNNTVNFTRGMFNFEGVEFVSKVSTYWSFNYGSVVTFYNCKFTKNTTGTFIIRIMNSEAFVYNGTATLSVNDAVGIFQLRYTSLLVCEFSTVTSSDLTNAIANTLGGCVINTRAINSSVLTTPFPTTSASVILGN